MQRMQTERQGCRRRAVSKERGARIESRIVLLSLVCLAALDVLAVDIPAAEQTNSIAGQLLIATADMGDPRFVETVIYIVKHSSEGAFGLVINRPLAKGPIGDLLKGFGMNTKGAKGEIVIHYGGPVGADQGFVLHSDEVLLDSSTKIKDGWAPGQLEAELKANAWYVIPADKALIFGKDADKKWREAMDKRQISL